MITFSVIALVVILIGLTLLWAYLCVKVFEDSSGILSERIGACGSATLIYVIAISFVLKYIIIWGQSLVR